MKVGIVYNFWRNAFFVRDKDMWIVIVWDSQLIHVFIFRSYTHGLQKSK